MRKAGDLLPWITGGLMLAAVAVAIAVSSTGRNAPAILPAPSPIAAPPRSTGVLAATSTPAPASVPDPAPAIVPALTATPIAQIQPANPPAASSAQIWECTINGLRTFSGKPCGDKPLVREIGPVNGMDAAPVLPYARSVEPDPRREPEYSYPGDQENPDPAQEGARTSYPVFIGIPVHEHRTPNRVRRPPDHGHRRVPPTPNK
jgi:hypothetical protein